ncbi:response regulator transcription factor [Lentzea sp. NPDC058436]|uniref:response regulator transcription factor n=1 Tax=Lentzea sp. NPDC058436 TaxID=3346499 RepID=UPI003663E327
MQRVLLVEDDRTIGQALESSLRLHGYEVDWSSTGAAARAAEPVDLVLLDLGLPDVDGVVLCRELRARMPQAVVVILTARVDEMDIVMGLEAGADDYLTKPVRLGELHARIKAHLRRGPAAPPGEHVIIVGGLRIDTSARRVTVDGTEVSLRAREFDLLARLAQEPGTAVSRDALMTDVWDAHWYGSTKTLDVHIAALRRKLAEPSGRAPEITTLRGHGYRLEITPAGL